MSYLSALCENFFVRKIVENHGFENGFVVVGKFEVAGYLV